MKSRKIKITAIVLLTLMLSFNFANVFANDGVGTFAFCTGKHTIVGHLDIWAESNGGTSHTVYISTWESCRNCDYIGNEKTSQTVKPHNYGPERDWHGAGTTHYYSADCQDCSYGYTRAVICKGPCATTDRIIVDILKYKEKCN